MRQGVTDGEAGLFLSPHDMARIGYLYLHNGMWDGKQIIPSSWVDRAKEGKVTATFGFHYANLWWSLPEKGAYMARGRHSQLILVLPKLDIVAVMTGILRDDEFYSTSRLIDDISKAVKSDTAVACRSHRDVFACRLDSPGRDGKAFCRRRHPGTGQGNIGKDFSVRSTTSCT